MSKKKVMLSALAVLLIAAIAVAGTLAYLTSTASSLTNTFVASAGLIDPNQPENPKLPEGVTNANFYLAESKVTYDAATGRYTLDEDTPVLQNSYENVVPGIEIPKDPTLRLNLAKDATAYLFLSVKNTLSAAWFETYAPAAATETADGWTAVTGVTMKDGSTLYVYTIKNGGGNVITGVDGYEVDALKLISGDKLTVRSTATAGTTNLGELVFNAYLCQTTGFDGAPAAFTACFPDAIQTAP